MLLVCIPWGNYTQAIQHILIVYIIQITFQNHGHGYIFKCTSLMKTTIVLLKYEAEYGQIEAPLLSRYKILAALVSLLVGLLDIDEIPVV